ncbi:heavy-metal-associated domain-containing protein [Kribbella sp. CA-247076]|uniref:heavy-metal-associated domain-containing protein n=1 Tax=Kribbella sp. CA-247076 TaxID=3239941 RepID=UPI003D8E2B3F
MSVESDPLPGRYDRAAAARVLAETASAQVFGTPGRPVDARFLGPVRRIEADVVPVVPAAGSHLTAVQADFVRTRMRPCPAELVTSAASAVSWRDNDGIANVAHCGPLGPVVPIVAREATLAMSRALAANADVTARARLLSGEARAVMAATTTDRDPVEILRVGVDTTARALVQHAYLADRTPYRDPAEFARGLRASGIFAVVANTWFWGLQSSTFRRGMIPVRFTVEDEAVRYSARTVSMLRAMKLTAIAAAETTQYASLPAGEQPRCLANMAVDGVRLLPGVVDSFVETFVRLLDLVRVGTGTEEETGMDSADEVFEVPDMTCSHCSNTITGVLEGLGVRVAEIDVDTKKVVAAFPSPEVREQSFEAIRGRGYTVVPRSA